MEAWHRVLTLGNFLTLLGAEERGWFGGLPVATGCQSKRRADAAQAERVGVRLGWGDSHFHHNADPAVPLFSGLKADVGSGIGSGRCLTYFQLRYDLDRLANVRDVQLASDVVIGYQNRGRFGDECQVGKPDRLGLSRKWPL